MSRVGITVLIVVMVGLMVQMSSCKTVEKELLEETRVETLAITNTLIPTRKPTTNDTENNVLETFMPTQTSTPEASLTPTEQVIEYENWGNNPETLTRYLVEKHGVMIPFNPVDNPEEFYEEINRIAYDSKMIEELGFIKPSKEISAGYDPVLKRTEIPGEIVVPFQVMFFQYKGENFPFIITDQNGTNNEVVLIYDYKYEESIQNNIKGNNVVLYTTEEMTDEIVDSYQQNGKISSHLANLIKVSGLSAGFLKQVQQ